MCLNCDESGLSQAVAYLSQFEQLTNTIEVIHLDKVYFAHVIICYEKLLNSLYNK